MALAYSVRDRSILLPHYQRIFVQPLLPAIPRAIPPNLITHAGHLLCLAALVACAMGHGLVAVVLLNAYLWCDNADGAHARRTQQCSATGEFLDHGLDLLNATYVAVMTILTLGAPAGWSVATAVVVPAAAAVTYWEQAETGTFQLGLFNQIESIACLTAAMIARAALGADAMKSVAVPMLAFGTVVALVGIAHSVVRVARHHGRVLPFVSPLAFGLALAAATVTGALGTFPAILVGAAAFISLGIRQLTLRVRGRKPITARSLLTAGAILAALAIAPALTRRFEWPVALALFGWLGAVATVRALRGHREVLAVDAERWAR